MSARKKSSPQRFPNLYALLNLNPLESDSAVIAAALQRLEKQLRSPRSADLDESSATRLAKLVDLGKQHLLDPESKARYDRQWRQHHQQPALNTQLNTASNPQPKPTPSQLSSESALAGLLPSGDPREAFRREEYIGTAPKLHQPDVASDFEQLQRVLRPAHAEADDLGSRDNMDGQEKTGADLGVARAATPTRKLPAQRRRKQRERRLLWLAIGGLASLATLLACVYRWSLPADPSAVQRSAPEVAFGSLAASRDIPLQPGEPAPQRRSGLPAVEGIVPEQDLTSNLDALVPVVAPPENASPDSAQDTGNGTTEPSLLQTQEPLMQNQASPVAATTGGPQLDDAERSAWAAAMQQAKQLIGQQQYAAAHQQLDANNKLAKTPLQQSQLVRLRQICSLAEEFQLALRRAIVGLAAGEVIMIGSSTPVALVDSTEESITIRIRGENRRFLLTELPLGLAFALADLSLDHSAASTLARKAAFAWTHAGAAGNDVAAQRARETLATAVAEGAADATLLQVFSDDYQLPALAPQSE